MRKMSITLETVCQVFQNGNVLVPQGGEPCVIITAPRVGWVLKKCYYDDVTRCFVIEWDSRDGVDGTTGVDFKTVQSLVAVWREKMLRKFRLRGE